MYIFCFFLFTKCMLYWYPNEYHNFFHVGILELPSPVDLETFSETFEERYFILDYT